MTTKRALPCDPLNSGVPGLLAPPCQLQSNRPSCRTSSKVSHPHDGWTPTSHQCQPHLRNGQSLGHDLQPPCIGVAARDVEVSDHHVCGNSGSCFPADLFPALSTANPRLLGTPALLQLPGGGQTVKTTATHTGTHRQRQKQSSDASRSTRHVGNDVKGTEAMVHSVISPMPSVRGTKEATPLPPGVARGPSQTPLSATLGVSGLFPRCLTSPALFWPQTS